jgi:diguanylate cyclase (GGDEF)-like protein/PAS domain S-box-containing protein
MSDKKKTKTQLLNELAELRQQIAELETLEKQRNQAEEVLRENKERYKALFDRSIYCVYVHDFEGRFIDANDAALNLLGYKKEDIPSVNFSTLFDEDQLPIAFKNMEELLQTGSQKRPIEHKLRKKDGGCVWVEAEGSVIYKQGNPYAIQGIARDITERKRAEGALRESEEKFRILAETNAAAIVIFQGEKFCYVNPTTEALTGYSKEELLKKNFGDFIHPEFRELVKEIESARLRGEKINPVNEFKIITKSGKTRWVTTTAGIVEFEGKPAALGTAFDITERKQVEEALQESEKKYRDLVDNALVGIYKTNLKGDILYVNEALWRMLEFESSEEMMAESALLRYKNPKDREVLIKNLKEKGEVNNFDVELLTKTGKTKNVLLSATFYDDILSGMIMDITERKRIEEALRDRIEFEKLITILSTNFINIAPKDLDKWISLALETVGEFVDVDRSYVFLFSSDETKMDNTHEWCAKGIKPQIQRLKGLSVGDFPWFAERIKKGETIHIPRVADLPPEASAEKEEFHLSKIQSLINIPMIYRKSIIGFLGFDSVRKEKIWPEDNIMLIKIIGEIFVNALVRKQAEKALKESEQKFRNIFENASDGVLVVDVETKKFYLGNKMICQMLNYSHEEIKNLTVMDIHPEEDLPYVLEQFEKLAREKIPLAENIPVKRKDGRVFYVDISSFWLKLAEKTYMAGIFRDITERKTSEEALRESEERYRTIFEDSRDAIYITTREGIFVEVNQSLLNLFGYIREEMIGLNAMQIYVNADERTRFQKEIEQNGSVKNYAVKFRKKDGTEMDCLLTSTLWKDINGTILGYQGIIRDVTELKKVEDQLRYISLHDPLTGLYNRAYFEEEMHRIESGRYDSAGIIMCDVDGLKLVNDALGHYTGDNLLLATANILKESFREGDVAARVGGDEFAVLLPNSDHNAIEIARLRIQDAVERHNSSNPPLPLSISIGSAIGAGSSIIMTNLFKEADNNMYREKLQNSLSARSTIVQTLMKALETRDFTAKGHISRLQKLSTDLAMSIGLQEQKITDLRLLAEFHDIGKVGISDHILFKTGPLTSEEIIEMQRHCEIGHRIALCTPDLIPIANLILKHHEWWNGKGYPLGIKGEEIPLECRIFAIAETYEAMTSDRPYHKAISHEEAVAELRRRSGTKFAPDLVTKFIEVLDNIKE